MQRRQRQLRENKLMRLYPFIGPISNVITFKLYWYLDLGIWSSETNVHYLVCCLTYHWRTHRSRVGSWDVHVSRISNIDIHHMKRDGGKVPSLNSLISCQSRFFSVPICWRFVSQMPCVRTRMQIHISMEAPGLLVTVSTVTVTMALSRVLKRCRSLHPMKKTLSAAVNRIVT